MAQQTITADKPAESKRPAPAKKSTLKGKRAIIWIPEKVESAVRIEKRAVQPAPVGSNQVRPMTFSWFDREATESRHTRHESDPLIGRPAAHVNAQPVLRSVTLIPGCNWVDIELWSNMCESPIPGDRINACKAERSIVEPELDESIASVVGHIDDYSNDAAADIINGTNDINELEGYVKTGKHRGLVDLIKGRIELLTTRLAGAS